MNFIKKAVLSIFLINSVICSAGSQEPKPIWKELPFPARINVAEGAGQIRYVERVNLNVIDAILQQSFKELITERWKEQLPWVLAATSEVDDKGRIWRNYFDAHAISRWLLGDSFRQLVNGINPTTGFRITNVYYFSINRSDKKFKYLGTIAQLLKNNPLEVRLFLKASGGDAGAMDNLGDLYENSGNIEDAKEWYKKAADRGDTDAMLALAGLFRDENNFEGAKEWYKKAADSGETDAMDYLGSLLKDKGDIEGAKEWYKKAADSGETDAMWNLTSLLEEIGDIEGAKEWYKRLVDSGNADAMYRLGFLVEKEENIESAKEWYKKALIEDKNLVYPKLHLIYLFGMSKADDLSDKIEQYVSDIKNDINDRNITRRYKNEYQDRWAVIQSVLDSVGQMNTGTSEKRKRESGDDNNDDIPAAAERRKR